MHGFGTLSIPDKGGGYKRLYAGGWKSGKRHVSYKNQIGVVFLPNIDLFSFLGLWNSVLSQ